LAHTPAWRDETPGVVSSLYGIWGSSSGDVHVVGGSLALHSRGLGAWTRISVTGANNLRSVTGTSATSVYAASQGGVFYSSGDDRWTLQHDGAVDLVYPIGAQHLIAIGHRAPYGEKLVLRSSGDGSWSDATAEYPSLSAAAWASGPDDVWVLGDD